MSTLTNITKHNGVLTAPVKHAVGVVFYGWLFWFTYPVYKSAVTNITKHNGALLGVAKH